MRFAAPSRSTATLAALIAGAAVLAPVARADVDGRYVGSAVCAGCHEGKFALWRETLHANVIHDATANPDLVLGDFTVPELGFTRQDVLYTIGSHWDQRYMTRIGGELYVLPKLWSVQSRQWRPYNVWSWKQRPWSRHCAGCHVTGYTPGDGAFVEMRIGCESCHGPGKVHAASRAAGDIVNPAKLDAERRDMICAACHVRGMDTSGEYYFPVGFLPGGDLSTCYVPIDMEDEEQPREAIKRLWVLWAQDREEKGRGKCEVCGIYGSSDKFREKMKVSEDVQKYCTKCHEFGDKTSNHTMHPEAVKLVCLDCHRPKPFSLEKEKVDVHSVRYYRIHQESCYDEDVDLACITCHQHLGRDRSWATREILVRWKKLPELDH